ncbi:MAG: hypothetical protein M3362_01375 [Acidobacteriota bacterium]|nr:hypothetical protein [Acidobacteriota bacterium]
MYTPLKATVFPDLHAFGIDSILKAALYFDAVYADSFSFRLTKLPQSEDNKFGAYNLDMDPVIYEVEPLQDLINEGVILPQPSIVAFDSFSGQQLPLSLREKITESLKVAPSFPSYQLGLFDQVPHKEYSIINNDLTDLDNPSVELASILHIISFLKMLSACSTGKAIPLTNNLAHSELLIELANYFPTVARVLGTRDISSLLPKQNAVAIKILEEMLPNLVVSNAQDILYLREEMKDELLVFRAEAGRLATTVESLPWEPNFQKEVETLVAKEVMPSLISLKRRLQNPSKRMLAHLVSDWKSIATSASVPISAIVMTNASLPLSILAGVATGLGIAAIKTKVEEWNVKQESSFTFLMEAAKRLEN